jgi:hypothetical protein
MLAMLGALLAGLVAFGAGEAAYDLFVPEEVMQRDTMSRRQLLHPTAETITMAAAKNASLAFGALGLCLGGFLGAAGGLARRSIAAAVTAGVSGAALGAVVAAGVSHAAIPSLIKAQYANRDQELLIAILMHALVCGLVGAAAGLAFASGLGHRRYLGRAVLGGLVGAVLGAIGFDLIGAAFFTSANTHFPISQTATTRLLARLLVALATAGVMVLFLAEPRELRAKGQADDEALSPAH